MIQLPLAIVGPGLVLWKLPEKQAEYIPDESHPTRSKLDRVDFLGASMLVDSVLTGMLSLDLAMKTGLTLTTVCLTASFVVFLLLFSVVEKHHAKEPILPLELVLKRDVFTSYSIVCFQTAGQLGVSGTPALHLKDCRLISCLSCSTRSRSTSKLSDGNLLRPAAAGLSPSWLGTPVAPYSASDSSPKRKSTRL